MARLKQIGIDLEVHRAIEQQRRSFSESPNEILRRVLRVSTNAATGNELHSQKPNRANYQTTATRARGLWTVELRGSRLAAANLKDAYRTLLLALADEFPHFLEQFSREKARSRRFVARAPSDLYLSSPGLARMHAKPLVDGWFFDTNLSSEQVSKRARIAARLCGLSYGSDVRILDNLKEI